MEMHGETAILIPSNITVTGVEQMIEIVHSLPATQKKKEDSHTYRASIKINNVPVIIYYFDLAHLSSLDRKNFILDIMKNILEDTDV